MATIIYTDGGSRGNPGLSAAAFYVPHLDVRVGVPLADSTNNTAEYKGLIEALKYASENLGLDSELEIRSDSKLMVEQMRRNFQVKSEALLELWGEATVLAEQFKSVEYVHVRRGENKVADLIANLTMDEMTKMSLNSNVQWEGESYKALSAWGS
jgi:ribonuclease HI